MYFINFKRRLAPSSFVLHLLPAGAVLVTMLGITILTWSNAKSSLRYEKDVVSTTIANDMTDRIREQIAGYELVLAATSGLFTASDEVTRQEWRSFVENFKLEEKYSSIKGIGYAKYVQKSQSQSFINQLRDEGYTDASLYPDTDYTDAVANYYYHPLNVTGLGFDFMSEPTRREAIRYAIKTGRPALTGKITFVKSKTQNGGSGVTLFLPVYDQPASASTDTKKLQGFVFAPINTSELFDQFFVEPHDSTTTYQFRIYDQETSESDTLYTSKSLNGVNHTNLYHKEVKIDTNGRTWVASFDFTPDVISHVARERPRNTIIAGTVLSFLLAGFVLTLLITRSRALSHAQQAEVNDVKDELLSLASHQLRTPATSVKQYIGMLKEGFAGNLSAQQSKLLDRAYESNERQLHIINELLYVAKLDANGIVLTPRRVDLNKLIRTQAEDLGATAKKSNQKIRVYLPKKPAIVEVDEHCIGMAVENLISNALKYSHEGTTTTVKLSSKKTKVEISVTDKGVGIEPEHIPLLFQRFSRIPNSYSQRTSGSGIGLYLSQQLINLHGGSITVDSIKDKGTTFVIHLPKKYIR